MSRTLNFVDCLLAEGRKLQNIGRSQDALQVFDRLVRVRDLPAGIAHEVHGRLADIYILHYHYARAEEHLTAALARQPEDSHYHYMLATALDLDADGNPEKALEHYRKSLELEPNQPRCLSDFGLLALSLDKTSEGMQALRRAAELAPDDSEVIGKLVEGLCQLDRADEARSILQSALFRNSHDSGFRKLWSDFQFQQLRETQEATFAGLPDARSTLDQPVLLPFIRLAPGTEPDRQGRKLVRRHERGSHARPHGPRLARISGRHGA